MTESAPGFGDTLVDYQALSRACSELESEFSLLSFMDLCALVEGIVLHERIFMVGVEPYQAPTASLSPLIGAGILAAEPRQSKPACLKPTKNPSGIPGALARAVGQSIPDCRSEVARLLGAEATYRVPPLVLTRQRPIYRKTGLVAQDHSACNVVAQYEKLSAALADLRTLGRLPSVEYVALPLPPIPLLALQRASSPDQLVVAAMDMRDEFAVLRRQLHSLRSQLADPTVAPSTKARAVGSWQRSWKSLDKYDDAANHLHMAVASKTMVDMAGSLAGATIDASQWPNIVARMVEQSADAFYSWRVRMMHKTAARYLAVSDAQVVAQVERLYDHSISTTEVQALQSLGIIQRE